MRLSSFRAVRQIPGTRAPAVFEIRFACPCGADHASLVTHDQLDWQPLGTAATAFYDVMTGHIASAAAELAEEAAHRIRQGHWPWAFFCQAEDSARPVFPSAFRILAPRRERMLVAVRCPSCAKTSVNVVSHGHLDLPFCSDAAVDVVDCVLDPGGEDELTELVEELRGAPLACTRHRLNTGSVPGHSRQG